MLTAKQIKFCEEYLRLDNALDAYVAAYNWNGSENGARVEASRLLARDDIQAHILRLRKPVEKAIKRQITADRKSKLDLIQRRIQACEERGDDAGIARYLEIWNKMDGEYLNGGKADDGDNNINDLDTATLLQLVKAE